MFVRIEDRMHGDKVVINTENIAMLWTDASVLVVCGNHGEGNGIIHTTKEDIQKILKHIKVIE